MLGSKGGVLVSSGSYVFLRRVVVILLFRGPVLFCFPRKQVSKCLLHSHGISDFLNFSVRLNAFDLLHSSASPFSMHCYIVDKIAE